MKANDLFKECAISMLGENCILCGSLAVVVHHIDPKGIGFTSLNVSFNPLNGAPLCTECHNTIHSVRGERWGKAEIYKRLSHLNKVNHITHPLEGETMREVIAELKELKEVLDGKRFSPKTNRRKESG